MSIATPSASRSLRGVVFVSALLGASSPGRAQVESPAPYEETVPVAASEAAAPEQAPAREPQTGLQEIIVTAQKREENIRDVPIAISVMSGEDLSRSAVSTFDDMARMVPNVSFNTDFNSLYMRGIGTAELNIISEQAVSYVLDGVYVSRLDYLKPGFMDVQRIEVLKGPQGTLYGRNATAGVINITYGEPTDEWMSSLALTGGSRNSRKAEAVVSGPLAEDLTFRFAGNTFREDGHTRNLADGENLGDKDVQQARMKLRYDFTESLNATLTANWFEYYIGVWAFNETSVSPAAYANSIGLLDPSLETEVDRRGSASMQNHSEGDGVVIPLQFNLDWADHTWTSITSYSRLDDFQGGDIDGSAADFAALLAWSKSHAWSQEFRVVSPPGAFEYVAGLFLFKSHFGVDLDIPLVLNPGANTVSGVTLLQPFVQILGTDLLDTVTGTVFPGGAADNLNGIASVDTKSLGVFGQATWHVTDTLTLLLGGRYSNDRRKGDVVESSDGPAPIWTLLTRGGFSARKKAVEENFSPKVSLTWEPDEAVTLYGTWAKGFRAGSYNIAALAGEADFEFEAERSTTFEAGVKTDLLGGLVRFNLGGFATRYKDYQLATFNGFGYTIANAEEVTSRGIESDVSAMIAPGLIATAALGYNRAKFVEYTNGGCPTVPYTSEGGLPPQGLAALTPKKICDLSGEPLFRAPKWTGNLGLNYDLPLSSWPVGLFAGANASYKGFEYIDADLDPVDSQDDYWLYNAHVGVRDADDRWSFVVHGKNLGDKLVKTWSGDIPLQAGAHGVLTNPPRSFFATVRVSF